MCDTSINTALMHHLAKFGGYTILFYRKLNMPKCWFAKSVRAALCKKMSRKCDLEFILGARFDLKIGFNNYACVKSIEIVH